MDCQYANGCPSDGGISTAAHTLPFTGAELSLFVAIALIIMCAGVCLRVYAEKRR